MKLRRSNGGEGGGERRREESGVKELNKGADRGVEVGVEGGVKVERAVVFEGNVFGEGGRRRRGRRRKGRGRDDREKAKLLCFGGDRTKSKKVSWKVFFPLLNSEIPEGFYALF